VVMLLHLDLCHPIKVMVIVPISAENWIWGDRNGTELSVMMTVQGFVRCDARSLWLVIKPNFKDGFMERTPMKIVQP
jgi:hypothetical protein